MRSIFTFSATTRHVGLAALVVVAALSVGCGKGSITGVDPLRYRDVFVGSGIEARPGNTVDIHWTGWLDDGQQFGSSFDQGEPFTFTLGIAQVIDGLDRGVTRMRAGGKRIITIPPELAYGETGLPPIIPPNATLTFEVLLLEVR